MSVQDDRTAGHEADQQEKPKPEQDAKHKAAEEN